MNISWKTIIKTQLAEYTPSLSSCSLFEKKYVSYKNINLKSKCQLINFFEPMSHPNITFVPNIFTGHMNHAQKIHCTESVVKSTSFYIE